MVKDFYIKVQQIDEALSSDPITPDLLSSTIQSIARDVDLRDYFLKRVKSVQWFSVLKKEKYFHVKNITFDRQNNTNFWKVLDYLERVSEQVAKDAKGNEEFGKELLVIVENVVRFSLKRKKEKGQGINHYHIWWYCVKILNNLPNTLIKNNLSIDNFKKWILVWTDHSGGVDLVISDIGEKLLGKFIEDDSMIEYAVIIIDVITEVSTGGKQQPLTNRKDARLRWDAFWILGAFKKHHKAIGQKCSPETIYGIADKLKNALGYRQKDYHVDFEIGTNHYRVKVSRVFVSGAKEDEIRFQDNSYECIVSQFSEGQLKDIDTKKDIYVLHNLKPEIPKKHFSFTAEVKDEFLRAIESNLPDDINWPNDENFDKKMSQLFDGLYDDYSYIWFKSLARSGSEHASGAEEVLTIILRDVLLARCENSPTEGRTILEAFLSNRYCFPVFRRCVLLCIDKCWPHFIDLFDKFFAVVTPNALHESDYEVELHDILQKHNKDKNFSQKLVNRLKVLINDIPRYYLEKDDKEKGEKMAAYWQFRWLSPLRENPVFKDWYAEKEKEANPKDGKPYEPDRSSDTWDEIVHKSPVTKEKISEMPVSELTKFLNEFQGADFWHGTFEGEPDKEGLAQSLQAAVKADPKKYTDKIEEFYGVNYFYVHRLLEGLKEAWNENKDLDWEKIFDFCLTYVDQGKEAFLKQAIQAQGEDSGKGKYLWVVEDIVDLIDGGSRHDERAFDPKLFDKVHHLFDLIWPFLKGQKEPEPQRDALTMALNTTFGRSIRAFMTFSLHVARVTGKPEENWGQRKYELLFAIGIEAYVWFGCYLPNLRYLDKPYTDAKIQTLTKKTGDDVEWQMFIDGYLGGSKIYKDLYQLMRPHYKKALGVKTLGQRSDRRLEDHITVGYLQGWELLQSQNSDGEESLFWKMLMEAGAAKDNNRWPEVVNFFWSQARGTLRRKEQESQKEMPAEVKQKILDFWIWCCDPKNEDIVKSGTGDQYDSFLGRLSELTILLDKIDEKFEKLLLMCAPRIEHQRGATFFIEYLAEFDDEESIDRIGKIYRKLLEKGTPTFRQEDIQNIVRKMYELSRKNTAKYAQVKKDADDICNTYGRRGVHFLKDLWVEYQKK